MHMIEAKRGLIMNRALFRIQAGCRGRHVACSCSDSPLGIPMGSSKEG
jgi:hypothetical protein